MKRRRKFFLGGALAGLALLLLISIVGDNGLLELRRLSAVKRALTAENAALTRENARLYRTIDRLQKDPVYLENLARRELGMIRGDELVFNFTTAPGKP